MGVSTCPVCDEELILEKDNNVTNKCVRCGRPLSVCSDDLVLDVTMLKHQYGIGQNAVIAVKELDLKVQSGEIVLLVGPSGGGKTTALLAMGLLLTPTSGTVRINGVDTALMSEKERARVRLTNIGFVFQQFNLMNSLTVLENVMLPMHYAGVENTFAKERAARILDLLGLKQRLSARPAELSGGEKQRVSIARALSLGPKLVLADEPTANLDSKAGKAVVKQLTSAAREAGAGVVIVTHDVRLSDMADRVAVLEDGILHNVDSSSRK